MEVQAKEDGVSTFTKPSVMHLATKDLRLVVKLWRNQLWLPFGQRFGNQRQRIEDEVLMHQSLASVSSQVCLPKEIFGETLKTDQGDLLLVNIYCGYWQQSTHIYYVLLYTHDRPYYLNII